MHLVDFLREELGLTGSHIGCEHGVCGACTVRVNGEIVRGCLMLAVQADGCTVETIEGLTDSKELAPLQKAFHEHNALQCGFCTPGMLMAAQDLVRTGKKCDAGGNPRAHLRQLLPLHGLPGDRRRDRGSDAASMGKAELPLHAPGTQVDRGYIGQSVPRPNAQRLLQGRGAFIDDLRFPRLAHVVFFRSPYAHARIKQLDFSKARASAGRHRGARRPRRRRVLHALGRGARAPEGHQVAAAARDRHRARVLAGRSGARRWSPSRARRPRTRRSSSRRSGKSCRSSSTWTRRSPGKRVIHPEFGDNICFKRELDTGGVDDAFAKADVVVEETFHFGRHTGVCLEGRAILADYNAGEHSLTVYHATQAPHMMQDIFSRHLGIPEANVRVITKDVGGSFGIKVHVYPDEMATAAISVMLRRPVKFVADRLESFLSDIHAREHKAQRAPGVHARRARSSPSSWTT